MEKLLIGTVWESFSMSFCTVSHPISPAHQKKWETIFCMEICSWTLLYLLRRKTYSLNSWLEIHLRGLEQMELKKLNPTLSSRAKTGAHMRNRWLTALTYPTSLAGCPWSLKPQTKRRLKKRLRNWKTTLNFHRLRSRGRNVKAGLSQGCTSDII